jgi:hypothetical protein
MDGSNSATRFFCVVYASLQASRDTHAVLQSTFASPAVASACTFHMCHVTPSMHCTENDAEWSMSQQECERVTADQRWDVVLVLFPGYEENDSQTIQPLNQVPDAIHPFAMNNLQQAQ